MRLEGGIYFNEDGLSQSIRAMHMQTELISMHTQNVTGFDKVGYQRKEPVVSAFSEIIGVHGLSQAVDDQVGRIFGTKYPLDLAIAKRGYFQYMDSDGSIKLTRDGRLQITKEGDVLGVDGKNLIAQGGGKLKLSYIPEKLEDIKVTPDGKVTVFNPQERKMEEIGTISVVASDGRTVIAPDIKQGYLEYSNVSLQQEFLDMIPVRKNFDANRQMFLIQRSNLSRAIQELGGG